jgi:flagellar hook-associated protein FlgK
VGNVARQAAISEQALEVVYQQAQEARDSISGVSLDEEASALVRFQQAYQANAKVMQTAMSLFESILQIR